MLENLLLAIVCMNLARAEESKKINFHPRPKASGEASVPDVKVPDRVCLINNQRFQVTTSIDESACVNKGGRVQLTSGETAGLPTVKEAGKDTSFNDRMNKMMQAPPKTQGMDYDKKARGSVHYDPLEANSP